MISKVRIQWPVMTIAACALSLAIPLAAANGPAKANKNPAEAAAMRSAWPRETLSGKIALVEPSEKLVVVKTPDGVPFDMMVTSQTRIKSGDQTITLKDLTQDLDKTVTVEFIPERRGDVAKSIQIGL